MIKEYGVDATRLNILFKAPPELVLEWDENSIQVAYNSVYEALARLICCGGCDPMAHTAG
jgi:leucyl-tRNA synthetase